MLRIALYITLVFVASHLLAQKENKTLIFAHRGASQDYPENSLLALRKALEKPYQTDFLEIDVRLSKDNILFLFHDKNTKRISTRDILFSKLSSLEIRKLFITNKKYKKKTSIASLEEVFQEFPQVPINIEIKDKDKRGLFASKVLWDLIQKYKREKQTWVVSSSSEVIKHFRKISQNLIKTGASAKEVFDFVFYCYLFHNNCNPLNYQVLEIPQFKFLRFIGIDITSKDFIKYAHSQKLKVIYWTINQKSEMQKLIQNKADGIITDVPDIAREVNERQ